jgi:hypothetical protein
VDVGSEKRWRNRRDRRKTEIRETDRRETTQGRERSLPEG